MLRVTPKTSLMDARGILFQAYETQYRIHDHLAQSRNEAMVMNPDQKRPLSAVAQQPAEDFSRTSRLYQLYELFVKNKVYPATGMNWLAFIELPHDLCLFILETCAHAVLVENQTSEAAIRRLQQEMGPTMPSGQR